MKNSSINISNKIDKSYIKTIEEIKNLADSLSIPFFIIGATARDFLMEYIHNIKVTRMTKDIDIGVRLKSWQDFNKLVDGLLKTGRFNKIREKHRLNYKDKFIDLLLFGAIAGNNFIISWPPEHDTIMSVIGFEEVFKHSTTVRLSVDPDLEVKISTIPGLVLLKILSWKDGYPDRQRDAEDILFIMKNYENAGIFNRLYKTELKILEEENFDNQMAGIRLLSKDIKTISNNNTLNHINTILEEETDEESNFNLVLQMIGEIRHYEFEDILNMLKKLKEGLSE